MYYNNYNALLQLMLIILSQISIYLIACKINTYILNNLRLIYVKLDAIITLATD